MSKLKTPPAPAQIATPCMFIDDGYSLPFVIPEVAGVSGEINGMYRPFTSAEKLRLSHDWSKFADDPEKSDLATCTAIAKHLIEWNVIDREGESVVINASNIGRLHPSSLVHRLLDALTEVSQAQSAESKAVTIVRDRSLDKPAKLEALRLLVESLPDAIDPDASVKN